MTPVFESRVNPGGNDPEVISYVYGASPPPVVSVKMYGLPVVAFVGLAEVNPTTSSSKSFTMKLPTESCTLTVHRKFPVLDGVPDMTPVVGFIVSPGGRSPSTIE